MAEGVPAAADGLTVEAVSFAIGQKQILRNVTLAVARGETTAVVGPSGCGKSTLLRVIAGLERPDSGSVNFGGEDLTAMPAARRGFGMMFQEYALFPHLEVAKNIAFGLRYSQLDGRARSSRIAELLELTGLAGFEKRRIQTLSGGEKQRVALARALATSPRLLMLDEPLGALDRTLRDRLIGELRETLRQVGVTSIYVTHDQSEAFAIANRMVMMRDGAIVRTGTPEEIYREPQTEFVARFLGMTNILDGQRDGSGTVVTPAGSWPNLAGHPGPVRLLLRDEGIRILESAASATLSGTLTDITYLGKTSRVTVQTAAGPFDFELPPQDLPSPGNAIHLHIPQPQLLGQDG